ncbi:unnamed protein product [Cylindrotheca closterium]|uniref:DUF6824 domain-containing protein n=1 Tax=Cylindrotheca closterium TaxID=2856 RepID=A0AAD2PVW4_9STRA|nr:unnamed protein product [Cylindrotheca closterium]CAJ1957805.1 unnamed protein product [Cylindrotheca closterium]
MNNPLLSDAQQIKIVEGFLASEVKQLSLKDQADAIDDLYCVGGGLNEHRALAQQALVDFDATLQTIRNPIYELAHNQNRLYVEDISFRLIFLRANFYNAKKAVHQMLSFLHKKAAYFGADKLARDITLEDLNEEEIKAILSGPYHVQEDKDRAGRVVVYFFSTLFGRYKANTLIRVTYYLWWNILLPKPEVQMKGAVWCYYDSTKPGQNVPVPESRVLPELLDFASTVPVRYSAMHYCLRTDDARGLALNNLFLGLSVKAMPRYSRARTRVHYGSHAELQSELQIHGLPTRFPIDTDGNLRKHLLNVWFHVHLAREETEPNPYLADLDSSTEDDEEIDDLPQEQEASVYEHIASMTSQSLVLKPTENDVLLGRGRSIQNHPGNIRFREIVDSYQDEYDRTPRNQRRNVSISVATRLKANGTRFLEQRKDSRGWEESSFEKCELTIRQLFRSKRKQMGV